MSAWPEAVWIVKKINQIFDITQIITDNNIKVGPLNDKLEQAMDIQTEVESNAQEAVQQINQTSGTLANLQTKVATLISDVGTLEAQLENIDSSAIAEAQAAIQQYQESINKELVVVATNSGTQQNPRPTNIGTNVSRHSVFLILSS